MSDFFNKLESVADQKTRLAAEQAQAKAREQKLELERRAAAPIIGRSVDTTGDLFDASSSDAPLFASRPARAPRTGSDGIGRDRTGSD